MRSMTPEEVHAAVAELFKQRMAKYVGETKVTRPLMEQIANDLYEIMQDLNSEREPPLIVVKPVGPGRVKATIYLEPPIDNLDVRLEI